MPALLPDACQAHPRRPPVAACVDCGRAICAACRCRLGGRSRCADCHRAALPPPSIPAPPAGRLTAAVLTVLGAAIVGALALGALAVQLRLEALERRNIEAMEELAFALEDFFLDLTRYPTRDEGLAALVSGDPDGDGQALPGWRGPYLRLSQSAIRYERLSGRFEDAWGHPIVYWTELDERWVYVASPGADGGFDAEGVGSLNFRGDAEGDDVLVWVERR